MLTPYVCVCCEKVIIAQDGVASLIGLFNKITVTVSTDAPEIPRNAVAPKEWFVFSSWNSEPGDELREFYVCTDVLLADRTPLGTTARVKMIIDPTKRFQNNIQLQGFPIGQEGPVTVRTWIEENQVAVGEPIIFKIDFAVSRQAT